MASLKEEARRWFGDFYGEVGWMLVWKTGRSWNITRLWDTEYDEGSNSLHHPRPSKWEISRDDAEKIVAAMEADPKAMVLNGYYDYLGNSEEMTLRSLIDGLKRQYDMSEGVGEKVMEAVNAVLATAEEDSQEDDQETDGMLARAMAKAAHEDEMLDGSDPLMTAPDEYDPLDDSNLMVVSPSLFKIPKYILPDPVGFQLSLCDQVDEIMKEA